jgi:PIN domain nuclease of toxin-antitoxin system
VLGRLRDQIVVPDDFETLCEDESRELFEQGCWCASCSTPTFFSGWLRPERLSESDRATILDPANDILFSAASIREIAIKATLRRAEFRVRPEAVAEEAHDIGFIELPVHSSIASRVADLPLIHRDPFDRLLIA